jgi:hypothetical protein
VITWRSLRLQRRHRIEPLRAAGDHRARANTDSHKQDSDSRKDDGIRVVCANQHRGEHGRRRRRGGRAENDADGKFERPLRPELERECVLYVPRRFGFARRLNIQSGKPRTEIVGPGRRDPRRS